MGNTRRRFSSFSGTCSTYVRRRRRLEQQRGTAPARSHAKTARRQAASDPMTGMRQGTAGTSPEKQRSARAPGEIHPRSIRKYPKERFLSARVAASVASVEILGQVSAKKKIPVRTRIKEQSLAARVAASVTLVDILGQVCLGLRVLPRHSIFP